MSDGDAQMLLPSDFEVPQTLQTRLAKRRFDENTVVLRDLVRDLSEGDPRRITMVYNGCGPNVLPDENDEPWWEFLARNSCSNVALPGVSILYPVTAGQVTPAPDGEAPGLFMQAFSETITENPLVGLSGLGASLAWTVPQRAQAAGLSLDPVLMNDPDLTPYALEGRCLAPLIVDGEERCANLEGTVVTEEDAADEETPTPVAGRSRRCRGAGPCG
jgi:hypothetical protein